MQKANLWNELQRNHSEVGRQQRQMNYLAKNFDQESNMLKIYSDDFTRNENLHSQQTSINS